MSTMKPISLTPAEVEHSLTLDRAAAALREARRCQNAARWLCIKCHGPDGYYVSECEFYE